MGREAFELISIQEVVDKVMETLLKEAARCEIQSGKDREQQGSWNRSRGDS